VRKEAGVAGPNAQPAKLEATAVRMHIQSGEQQITLEGRTVQDVLALQQSQIHQIEAGGRSVGADESDTAQSGPGQPEPANEAENRKETEMSQQQQAASAGAPGTPVAVAQPTQAQQPAATPRAAAPTAQPPAGDARPATIAELEAQFAGEDKFVLRAAKLGWTMDEAKASFEVIQQDRLSRQQTAAGGGLGGVPVLGKVPGIKALESAPAERTAAGAASTSDGEASAELKSRVEQLIAQRPGLTVAQASGRILSEDDDLRARYVQEQNAARESRVSDRIQERLALRR
jgi:hypothetical protein